MAPVADAISAIADHRNCAAAGSALTSARTNACSGSMTTSRRSLISRSWRLSSSKNGVRASALLSVVIKWPCPAGVWQRQHDQAFGMAQPPRCWIDTIQATMNGIEAVLGGDHDRSAIDRDSPAEDQTRLLQAGNAGGDLQREVEGKIALAESAHGGDQRRDAERDRAFAKPCDRSRLAGVAIRRPVP